MCCTLLPGYIALLCEIYVVRLMRGRERTQANVLGEPVYHIRHSVVGCSKSCGVI